MNRFEIAGGEIYQMLDSLVSLCCWIFETSLPTGSIRFVIMVSHGCNEPAKLMLGRFEVLFRLVYRVYCARCDFCE